MKNYWINEKGTWGIFDGKGKLIEKSRTKDFANKRKKELEKDSFYLEEFEIIKLKNQLGIRL